MKRARIRYEDKIHAVTVEAENAVRLKDGRLLAEDQVEWLPPATGNMFALGLNYADHAAETGAPIPDEPILFSKWTSSIVGPNDNVEIPRNSSKTDWEVELGVVIG